MNCKSIDATFHIERPKIVFNAEDAEKCRPLRSFANTSAPFAFKNQVRNAKGGTSPASKRPDLVEVALLLFFELLLNQQLCQLGHDFPGDLAHDLI